MRGRDGYDRVIQVVETLKDEVPLSLMFCLSPWNNFDDMTFVIDIAKQYDVDVRIGIYGTMAFFDTTSELLTASGFACQQVAPASYILMFQHPHIVGTLELSTSYTWTTAEESLKVCTSSGVYRLSQMEELTFESKSSTILGIPIDKVHKYNKSIEHLYVRNNFIPILPNNQVYAQGFFNELQAFVNAVEGRKENIFSSIEATRETYRLIEKLRLAYFANRLDDDSTIDDGFVS
jgi:predicted dehydrogenase